MAPISFIELDSAILDLAHPCFVTFHSRQCSRQLNGQERAQLLRESPTDFPAPDTATLCANKSNLVAGLGKARVLKGLLVGLWFPQHHVVEATPAQEGPPAQARESIAKSPYSYPVIKRAEGQPMYPVCVIMNIAAAIRHRAAFYVLTEPEQGGMLRGFWNAASMDDTYFLPAYRDDIMCASLAARKSCVSNLAYRAFKDLGSQDAQSLRAPKAPRPAQSQRATRLSTGAQARANYRYEPLNLEMEVADTDMADKNMDDENIADKSTIQPVEEPVMESVVEPDKVPDTSAKETAEDMADQDLLWVLIKNRALKITKKAVFDAWEDFAVRTARLPTVKLAVAQ